MRLRPPGPGDREAFLRAVRASEPLHRPWVWPPATRRDYDGWLEEGRGGHRERFLVWVGDASPELAGYVAANEIVHGALQSAYLGYWASADHVGRGLLREALAVFLDHLFLRPRLPLHRVEANIQPDNEASRTVVRALGFRLEGFSPRYLRIAGQWRDHERWALTREEWPPAPRE